MPLITGQPVCIDAGSMVPLGCCTETSMRTSAHERNVAGLRGCTTQGPVGNLPFSNCSCAHIHKLLAHKSLT